MTRWSRETATMPWPEDIFVQGGSSGLVVGKDRSYRTAFVEAFPPGGFIRGEGPTLADAEEAAYKAYIRQMECETTRGHEFDRGGYTNGGGICRHCGGFRSKVFDALPEDPDRELSTVETLLRHLADRARGSGETGD